MREKKITHLRKKLLIFSLFTSDYNKLIHGRSINEDKIKSFVFNAKEKLFNLKKENIQQIREKINSYFKKD